MPLIIVTGLPSSGKSTSSKILSDYLIEKLKKEGDSRKVRIVTDADNLDWDGRDTIYMSIPKEKELRGWLRAEASRYANLNQIVILDAAAYIKGFRYELYCLAREAKTRHCVVELMVDPETCWVWNQTREEKYKRETFDALLLRYEKCDGKDRWDSPLFRVTKPCELDDELLNKIYESVTTAEPLVPSKCTARWL